MADETRDALCQRVRENLAAYLDGEVSDRARAAIRAHLASCPECRAHLDELKETWSLLDELEEPIMPRRRLDLGDRLAREVARERRRGPLARLRDATGARGLVSGLAAAVLAAAFLVGLYATTAPPADAPTPAERQCILYLDLLEDVQTLEQMDMVAHMQALGGDDAGEDVPAPTDSDDAPASAQEDADG